MQRGPSRPCQRRKRACAAPAVAVEMVPIYVRFADLYGTPFDFVRELKHGESDSYPVELNKSNTSETETSSSINGISNHAHEQTEGK